MKKNLEKLKLEVHSILRYDYCLTIMRAWIAR